MVNPTPSISSGTTPAPLNLALTQPSRNTANLETQKPHLGCGLLLALLVSSLALAVGSRLLSRGSLLHLRAPEGRSSEGQTGQS